MIYFTSDPHFLHKNILRYRKQFNSLEEMHELIIQNWNKTVKNTDTIYILGDMFLGPNREIAGIMERLNGRKILIRGNHDHNSSVKKMLPFLEGDYSLYTLKHNKVLYSLCHFPMREWNTKEYSGIHLYGHVHDNDHRGGRLAHPNAYHVGMDTNDFTPVSIERVNEIIQEQNKRYNSRFLNKVKRFLQKRSGK